MRSCAFSGNTSVSHGGAIFLTNGATGDIKNCSLTLNTAGGTGGGIGVRSTGNVSQALVHNCIVYGNSAASASELGSIDGGVVTASYSDIGGGFSGDGNMDIPPLLTNGDGVDDIPGTLDDNLHLRSISPCIDAGDPAFLPQPGETDFDGQARVMACEVDMGADEYLAGAGSSGDMDNNAATELADVPLFVQALLSGAAICTADVNNDGAIDGRDVAGFVDILVP